MQNIKHGALAVLIVLLVTGCSNARKQSEIVYLECRIPTHLTQTELPPLPDLKSNGDTEDYTNDLLEWGEKGYTRLQEIESKYGG